MVVAVVFVAVSRALLAAMDLQTVNRETSLAHNGLRAKLEELEGLGDFASAFRRYNADPSDDVPGERSPGASFAVASLQPVVGDADGFVGQILFPVVDTGAALHLREDLVVPELGMPRDLDGNGLTDELDHSGNYRLLPVLLRLEWQGQSGQRTAELRTMLADR